MRKWKKPEIKFELIGREAVMNCPSTSVKYCGVPFSPKKG